MKNFPADATHVWDGTFCKVEGSEVWFYDASIPEWFHTGFTVEVLEANATELYFFDDGVNESVYAVRTLPNCF